MDIYNKYAQLIKFPFQNHFEGEFLITVEMLIKMSKK
jgi:hypothetical protein